MITTMETTQAVLSSLTNGSLLAPHLGHQPNIIPSTFSPSVRVDVAFAGQTVQLGNVVRAEQCKEAPQVRIVPLNEAGGESERYTLLLVDPDAPTPDDPKFGYWRHWVVRGLRGGFEEGDVEGESETLTKWLGPGPKDE
jgi:phosphatidylethanolamine-binding protein